MSNVKRFPGSAERRRRRNLSAGKVECQVSPRWLQFPEQATLVGGASFMAVDVMTLDSNDKPKKLCELILTKEDIAAMLLRVSVAD
ncbi:hypothetical protein [Burkholderia gladioli]|uniref:hypothetical protein n=1 Tax=Burkholderia gladioli TaxID=28095 RepID=UPI001640BA0A|nr:hypothetical protein [Burkholderia gladioli]MDN7813751.1 hypothetical protein [Burkholderia gladioli]